ncbi:MAG: hypothetical protein CMQ15_14910 [Gammaproteobacteria bacterium]|mgnify:FL=1|jgi:hypothetical protein|nr:hypothetical protein [Gammaproteobacteria bacterium]|tara:strand:+ start:7877 stop:8476 length:600 start_codon:yes stop_codon:yes gene_type:complete
MNRNPAKRQNGITLLEVLVVIVLTGMISTILLQTIGFSLASYQRSRVFQQQYQAQTLGLNWFRASIENMMASHDPEFAFLGSENSIEGYSLAPVFSKPGSLVRAEWTIRGGNDKQDLWYQENEGELMLVASWNADQAFFKYRHRRSQWLNQWPVEQVRPGTLPWRIELTIQDRSSQEEQAVLMATKLRQFPVFDYRDLL